MKKHTVIVLSSLFLFGVLLFTYAQIFAQNTSATTYNLNGSDITEKQTYDSEAGDLPTDTQEVTADEFNTILQTLNDVSNSNDNYFTISKGGGRGNQNEINILRLVSAVTTGVVNNVSAGFTLQGSSSGTSSPDGVLKINLNEGAGDENTWGYVPQKTVMTLFGNGNVGIGTDNPQTSLEVAGTIKSQETLVDSDKHLKENIFSITGAISIIKNLHGVFFDWKKNQKTQTGFIAQEANSVVPWLVEQDADGQFSMNYSGVIPILVEALKEQQKSIEEQEQHIISLEKRLQILEKKIQ